MNDYKEGKYKVFKIKVSGTYYPVACLTSNSFNEQIEMLDTTTRDNEGWKTSIPTWQDYTVSLSGLIDENDNIVTYSYLENLKRNRTIFDWQLEDEIDGIYDEGRGFITSLSNDANVDDYISFSAEVQGYSYVNEITD